MTHFALLTLLFFAACPFTYSQSWKRIGDWGNELTDIKWVNEEVAYIAGDNIMLKSIDGGVSWKEQEAPTNQLMLALDFYDEKNGIVVGDNGTVYQTLNGGKNWQLLDLGTLTPLKAVTYVTADKLFITGDNGSLYRSLDGGKKWAKQQLNQSGDLNSIYFVNTESGYIVSSWGKIIKTVDGGMTWQILMDDFGFAIKDIHFLNESVGYAVGDHGSIIKTEDKGNSWSHINSGMDTDFNKVVFNKSNPSVGIVTGKNGILLRTSNGGLTFATSGSRTLETITGIGFRPNSDVVYAVGESGVVISSANSGGNWVVKYSGRANDYTGVQFTDGMRGYVIGNKGLVLLTGNGGASFSEKSRPLSLPFNALYFINATTGYVSGNNGNIITTTNSGGSWSALNPGTSRDISGMYFFSIDEGYVVGSKGYIAMTANRGVNWSVIAPGDGLVDYHDIGFFDGATGIIIGNSGWISRSEGGQEWVKIDIPTTENLNALKIIDGNSAIVIGDNGSIFKTNDQGHTWENIQISHSHRLNGIDFLDGFMGFIVGDKGLVLKTSDGGQTFEQLETGTFQNLTDISFGDLNTAYAVGEHGAMFNYSCRTPEALTTITGEEYSCLREQVYTVKEGTEAELYYEWRVDGGTILDGQGTTKAVIRWDSPGRNAIIVRGQNSCGNGLPAALEVVVSPASKPATTIYGNGTVCLNTLEAYHVDSLPGTEYIWEAKGGLIKSGQRTSKVTIEWTRPGHQAITVSSKNTCGESEGFEKKVFASKAPSKPLVIQGSQTVGLGETDYTIEAEPEINYQWSTDSAGIIVSGQGTGTIKILWEKEGDYTVKVTPANVCNEGESQTLAINVSLITGFGGKSDDPALIVYPNPSSGSFKIRTQGIEDVQEIALINVLGQIIYQTQPKSRRDEFSISNIPGGLHSVILKSKSKIYTKRIIVR